MWYSFYPLLFFVILVILAKTGDDWNMLMSTIVKYVIKRFLAPPLPQPLVDFIIIISKLPKLKQYFLQFPIFTRISMKHFVAWEILKFSLTTITYNTIMIYSSFRMKSTYSVESSRGGEICTILCIKSINKYYR